MAGSTVDSEELVPSEWTEAAFSDLFRRRNGKANQIQTNEYKDFGPVPVVDQGQKEIIAYSDKTESAFRVPEGGLIVFGDHTRIVKFVDFDFLVGADGTQLLAARAPHVPRFLYYLLDFHEVPEAGYSRHLKFLLEASFRVPGPEEQRCIAEVLSNTDELIVSLERLIAKKREIKQGAMQQLLTGRTRLPGFDGEWDRVALGSLGAFSKGRGIKRDDVQAKGMPCVRYGEIYTRYGDYVERPISYVSPTVAETALPIRSRDLLFAGSGETAEEIGMCVAFIGKQAVAGGDIIALRPRPGNDPVFLAGLLNQPPAQGQKARLAQGDAVVHISSGALASIELAVPELDEQEAIGQVMRDMDAEIKALETRLAKTRDVKQGMMQELLTGRTRLPAPDDDGELEPEGPAADQSAAEEDAEAAEAAV